MNYRDVIERVLSEYRLMLGIRDDVKFRVRRYKTKAASSNIKARTICINEDLLDLGEDIIKYLVLHELLHIKLQSRHHDERFYAMLHFFMPPEEVDAIRDVIMKRMLQNHMTKRISR
jgi:predicted metal-dependent hydrolase